MQRLPCHEERERVVKTGHEEREEGMRSGASGERERESSGGGHSANETRSART